MSDPSRLSISVTHADGSQTRWGYNEADTANIPLGLSFSTALPGGFKDASFSLPRYLTREYNDESLFDLVTVYGAGNQIAWQGRVQQLPREQGGRASVQVGCVGLSAVLKDAPLLSEIYVDRVEGWSGPSLARRAAIVGGGSYAPEDAGTTPDPDNGVSVVTTAITGPWSAAPGLPLTEGWYQSQGVTIGKVYYAVKPNAHVASNVTAGDTKWHWTVSLYDDEAAVTGNSTGELRSAVPVTGTLSATTTSRKYATLSFYYTAAGGDTREYALFWTCLGVYGNHGLTLRGTGSASQAPGVYASDVIRDVLARCAPSLPIAQIDDTTFTIPQLVFSGASAEDAILEVSKYHLYPWGVYEDGFFWKQNNESTSTVYEARLSDGAQMSLEGDDASGVYNGIVISYNDADGKPRIAAPPGVTYADYTSSDLLSSDPNNPATLHGLTRYGQLQISSPLPNKNADGDNPAIQIGRMWMAEQALPARRGSITLPAMVRHPTEGMVPSWRVRAGDWIRVADRPGDVARRIVSTSYAEDGRSMTLDVGGLPAKVEALLEAIGVQMVGIA